MKKKIIAGLLALTLVAGTMTPLGVSAEEQPEAFAGNVEAQNDGTGVRTGTCGDSATYTLDENGVLTIEGSGAIKEAAFADFDGNDDRKIKQVVISSGITEIKSYAFAGRSDLKSIKIPDSVTGIGEDILNNCSSLEDITVDAANTTYESPEGSNALIQTKSKTLIAGCKNTKIPDDVNKIGDNAFYGCSDLTAIYIPKSITKVGTNVFAYCSNLNSITIDPNNTTYVVQNNGNAIIYKANMALLEGCNTTVIPEGVKTIRQTAFTGRENLKSITIPVSVTRIGNSDAPGQWVFDSCSNLDEIKVDEGNTTYDSRDNCNAIIETATNTLLVGSNTTVIPKSVEVIDSYAFFDRKGLTKIAISESVTEIRDSAFDGCENLSSVSLQKGLQQIGSYAFDACYDLTDVTFCGTAADWQAVSIDEDDRAELEAHLRYHALLKTEEVPATCIKAGTAVYWTCKVCDKMYGTEDVAQNPQEITAPVTIPATGKHSYTVKKVDAKYLAVAATCTKPTKYYYLCSGCGAFVKDDAYTFENGTAKGHRWNTGVVTKQPTTEKEGIKTYTCTVCQATKQESIAKLKPVTNNNSNNNSNSNNNNNKNNNSNNNSNNNNNKNNNSNNNSNNNNNNNNNNTVKKGTKVTIKGYKYTVKNSSEVTFTGVKNKKAKKISIPAKVKIKNKNYKVTAMSAKSLKGVQAKTLIVGSNVQTIGNSAMENCKKLTNVTLGKNVKKIGKNAFKSDKKLKKITMKSIKLKSVGKNAFKGINSKAKITVPKKKYSSYKKLMKGKGQGKKVKIVKAK